MELILATLRLATPLIFASLGGVLCERAGIATICLEGIMLVAAFAAGSTAVISGSSEMALFIGVCSGCFLMGLHELLTQKADADPVVSGMAINILALGLTPLLSKFFFDSATNTPSLPPTTRLHPVPLPLLGDLPTVGILFKQSFLIYIALLLPFVVHVLLKRSVLGRRIHSAGDGPEALSAAGVSVHRVRALALWIGGWLTPLAGVYLVLDHTGQFLRDMTAGRGFIALAAVIFGRWQPIPVFLACLFFGFSEALQMVLQNVSVGSKTIPLQWLQSIPYLVALAILIFSRKGNKEPRVFRRRPV